MPPERAKTLTWLLVAAHVATDGIVVALGPHRGGPSLVFAALIGLFAAQASLAAIWLALGGGPLIVRLALSLLAVGVFAWCAAYLERGQTDELWVLYALFGLSLVAACAPFALLRLRGSQLIQTNQYSDAAREALQFSIRDLAIWTVGAAVALGTLRWAGQLVPGNRVLVAREIWVVLVFGGSFAATGVIAAWAALGTRFTALRVAAFCLTTPLAGTAPVLLLGLGGGGRPGLYTTISVTQGLIVLASLFVLRFAQYRLVAPDKAESAPPAVASSRGASTA